MKKSYTLKDLRRLAMYLSAPLAPPKRLAMHLSDKLWVHIVCAGEWCILKNFAGAPQRLAMHLFGAARTSPLRYVPFGGAGISHPAGATTH